MDTLVLSSGAALVDEAARAVIERALPAFLAHQRWFAGKARGTASASVLARTPLAASPAHPTLLIARVQHQDGGDAQYAVPVSIATAEEAARIARDHPDRVLARVDGEPAGVVHDRVEFGLADALLDVIASSTRLPLGQGVVVGEPTSAYTDARGPAASLPARQVAGEQSNTSIVFGDRLILKIVRRLEPGLHPDYEIGRHLTERSPFAGVPTLAGALVWRTPGAAEGTVIGILQSLVPHDANAWEDAVAQLKGLIDRQGARPAWRPGDEAMRDAAARTLASASWLGRRTGELHRALADAHGDPAFEPEPLDAAGLAAIAGAMRAHTARVLARVSDHAGRLPSAWAPLARTVAAAGTRLLGEIDRLADVTPGLARIRVHGDYHLGQVLVSGDDAAILDFEGEPLRSLDERRAKHLALKDVAGMLRSYSYAAYAALFEACADAASIDRLEPVARWWEGAAADAFLDAYRTATAGAAFVPADPAEFGVVLRAYLIEKAVYEFDYEVNNRPGWVRIPLRGLVGLLKARADGALDE